MIKIPTLLLALAFVLPVSISSAQAQGEMSQAPQANIQYPNDCRWDPQGSSVCRGRNFCFMSPAHPKCRLYCSYYPYDRVCNRW